MDEWKWSDVTNTKNNSLEIIKLGIIQLINRNDFITAIKWLWWCSLYTRNLALANFGRELSSATQFFTISPQAKDANNGRIVRYVTIELYYVNWTKRQNKRRYYFQKLLRSRAYVLSTKNQREKMEVFLNYLGHKFSTL